jgi:hypothetical protein
MPVSVPDLALVVAALLEPFRAWIFKSDALLRHPVAVICSGGASRDLLEGDR